MPGAELGIDSDGFFALNAHPRSVAVIGASYVGVELAGILRALGSEVSIVAMEQQLLETFESLIGETVTSTMRLQHTIIDMNFQVNALERDSQGIALVAENGERLQGYNQVIWAVGRRPLPCGSPI